MKKNGKIKLLPIILVGFLAGLVGAYLMLNLSGRSNLSLNDTGQTTTTSKVVYNNTTDTTKAAKTVQDAVVSVI
ncbi:serine protease, partial [Streptococcus pluranimalium]